MRLTWKPRPDSCCASRSALACSAKVPSCTIQPLPGLLVTVTGVACGAAGGEAADAAALVAGTACCTCACGTGGSAAGAAGADGAGESAGDARPSSSRLIV